MNEEYEPYRILSLDGGGLRGIYQATFLSTLLDRIGKVEGKDVSRFDLGSCFDMIVGTSTGAIIASALYANVPLEDVIRMYWDKGSEIFPYQTLRSIPGLRRLIIAFGIGTRSGGDSLRQSLEYVFKTKTIGDVYSERKIAFCVPTVDLQRHTAVVFKSPHLSRSNHRDDNRTLVDVCLASTAAPLFRESAVLKEPSSGNVSTMYVDGGLWANNPSAVALIDAIEYQGNNRDRPIHLYKLGTLQSQGGEMLKKMKPYRNIFQWDAGALPIQVSLDAQAVGYDYISDKMAIHYNGESFAYRFRSQCPSEALQRILKHMDDARHSSLQAMQRQALSDVDLEWGSAFSLESSKHPFKQLVAHLKNKVNQVQ